MSTFALGKEETMHIPWSAPIYQCSWVLKLKFCVKLIAKPFSFSLLFFLFLLFSFGMWPNVANLGGKKIL